MAQKNNVYELTQDGVIKLQEELVNLKTVERPAIIETIKDARAQGDLSENADYDAAKDKQAVIEARISEIENILKNKKIIKLDQTDTITGGKTVTFEYLDSQKTVTYTFVGSLEVDPKNFKISIESPIGKALLGNHPDDIVHVKSETGKEFDVKVISVRN